MNQEERSVLESALSDHLQGSDKDETVRILCDAVLGTTATSSNLGQSLRSRDFYLFDESSAAGEDKSSPGARREPDLKEFEEGLKGICNRGGGKKAMLQYVLGTLTEDDWTAIRATQSFFVATIGSEGDHREDEGVCIGGKNQLANAMAQVETALNQLQSSSVTLIFSRNEDGKFNNLVVNFSTDEDTAHTAHRWYTIVRALRDKPAERRLREELDKTVEDLQQNGLHYASDLVTVDTKGAPFVDESLFLRGGKKNTLVIGGESGSGKSWYAAFGVAKGVPRLYLEIRSSDLVQEEQKEGAPAKNLHRWNDTDLVKKVRKFANNLQPDNDSRVVIAKKALHRCCTTLHKDRHDWVEKLLDWKIDKLKSKSELASSWFLDDSQTTKINKFLLVVDEVGRDEDLLHGLIDYGHTYLSKKLGNRVEDIGLVLVGTSLDDLYKNSDDEPMVGSNPEDTQVVVMRGANLNSLSSAAQLKYLSTEGVSAGLYSGPFSTNARILVLILRPFFESMYGSHCENDKTKAEHIQTLIGSSYPSMSFVPSAYCQHNGLRTKDAKKRQKLFQVAFCSLLKVSISNRHSSLTTVMTHLVDHVWTEEKQKEARAVGLVTKDPEHTSDALKLLACKGLAAPIIKGDGASLEYAVSLSLVRQLECAEFICRTYTLQGAWPPPWKSKPTNKENIPKWELTDNHLRDLKVIRTFLSDGRKRSIVLIQGVPNAQGPDLMVLRPSNLDCGREDQDDANLSLDSLNESFSMDENLSIDESVRISELYSLDLYQAKDIGRSNRVDSMTRTLGVVDSNQNLVADDANPSGETALSALYSHNAMEIFCNEVGGEKVSIGDRVLVRPKMLALSEGYVKLWTRFHLEPCFSIFSSHLA